MRPGTFPLCLSVSPSPNSSCSYRKSVFSGTCPCLCRQKQSDLHVVSSLWPLCFLVVWRCHTESGQAPVIYPTALICLPSLPVSSGGQPCVQSQSTCLELPTFCLVLKAPQLDLCACLGSLSPWRNHPVVCVLCSGGGSMVGWVIATCRSISATIWSWLLTYSPEISASWLVKLAIMPTPSCRDMD